MLGVDRVTVFRWIKSGKVKADMIGGVYVIPIEHLPHHILGELSEEKKDEIREAVSEAIKEYGDTFRALAKE